MGKNEMFRKVWYQAMCNVVGDLKEKVCAPNGRSRVGHPEVACTSAATLLTLQYDETGVLETRLKDTINHWLELMFEAQVM